MRLKGVWRIYAPPNYHTNMMLLFDNNRDIKAYTPHFIPICAIFLAKMNVFGIVQ
jgi:hypothetical protein